MKSLLSAGLLTFILASAALADIARPDKTANPTKKPKSIETNLNIKLDRDAKEAKLLIPRSQIGQLRAELEDLDNDTGTTAASTFSRTQTIVSGIFLSLAMVFGGLWLSQKGVTKAKAAKGVALCGVIGIAGFAASMAFANAGPPSEARSITGKMFSQAVHTYGFGWGKVRLEVTDDNVLTLIVPNPPDKPTPGE